MASAWSRSRRTTTHEERCPREDACFADGATLLDEARTAGTISTAMFAVGGAFLAAGIIVLATARLGRRDKGRRASALVAPTGFGLRVAW